MEKEYSKEELDALDFKIKGLEEKVNLIKSDLAEQDAIRYGYEIKLKNYLKTAIISFILIVGSYYLYCYVAGRYNNNPYSDAIMIIIVNVWKVGGGIGIIFLVIKPLMKYMTNRPSNKAIQRAKIRGIETIGTKIVEATEQSIILTQRLTIVEEKLKHEKWKLRMMDDTADRDLFDYYK